MTYHVIVARSAKKELLKLSETTQDRIATRLVQLSDDPRPYDCRKLKGRTDYRLRVGDYRILYSVNDPERTVIVSAIGHRRDVYK